MSAEQTNNAMNLALSALVWVLQDEERADRFLALTGLDAASIRARVTEPALLEAVLGYLESHEPDLIACAKTLDVPPMALVLARERLAN
jgi:hypothetical protein